MSLFYYPKLVYNRSQKLWGHPLMELLLYRRGELLPPHYYFQAEAAMRIIFEYSGGYDLPPQSDPEMMHIVIARGRELIAYTAVISTTLEHQGTTYQCGGLSGVLTFPAF